MNLNSRETILGWTAFVVILFGGTFWWGEPMVAELSKRTQKKEALEDRKRIALKLLSQKDELYLRLDKLIEEMPRYPFGQDATPQLLKKLQRIADKHGLTLKSNTPIKEKNVGDIYETSIRSRWEGSLKSAVDFLYALQSQGVMVDMNELSIKPVRREQDRLNGQFVVDYAYSRYSSKDAEENPKD
ncbi:MAG: type 4a pilus biogenesis protein PilO [Kiritimatiellae bacterium]|nr:type 4a pilus biogenesis protein PilO [Kiritimatiellia bacterium]